MSSPLLSRLFLVRPASPSPWLFLSLGPLHTTCTSRRLRDKFIFERDLNKRPSALEIKSKKLPENTPTVGERSRRSRQHLFHQSDPKHGYWMGPTGTWRDYVDPNSTTKELMRIGWEELFRQAQMAKEDLVYAMTRSAKGTCRS